MASISPCKAGLQGRTEFRVREHEPRMLKRRSYVGERRLAKQARAEMRQSREFSFNQRDSLDEPGGETAPRGVGQGGEGDSAPFGYGQ